MKNNQVLMILLGSLAVSPVLAYSTFIAEQQLSWPHQPWIMSISGGLAWQLHSDSQTQNLTPEVTKTYHVNHSDETLVNGELFIGLQQALPHNWQGQWGLALSTTENATEKGMIWDDADPSFANYYYRYKISHSFLGLKGVLLMDVGYWLTPWISASAGVGFNHAYEYTNTPILAEAVVNPNFNSSSNRAFSYTVGIGVQKNLSEHWQAGIGYQFADWGKSELGMAPGQTIGSGLAQDHLYTSGFLINVTYVA
ncbi:MAG: outer membrane beta-barrel protein [Gammaproteobacteria bacterium]|nr:outer membrane beta-barrel protein [Gammaproteobacteria bacterium]